MSHYHSNRLQQIQSIESEIEVPEVPYYPTQVGGRFIYKRGAVTKEIIISNGNGLDGALFLKKHGMIHTYVACQDGSVKMFIRKDMHCQKGLFWANSQAVRWQDFKFTTGHIITFAAVHELELQEKQYGIVVSMFPTKLNRAA